MTPIESKLQKLKLLEVPILAYNGFGIVYEEDEETKLILLKSDTKTVIKKSETKNIRGVDTCKHFISLRSYRPAELYVKGRASNILNKYGVLRYVYYDEESESTKLSVQLETDKDVVVILTNNNKIIAINSKGETLDISIYGRILKQYIQIGLFYDKDKCLYSICCEHPDDIKRGVRWRFDAFGNNTSLGEKYTIVTFSSDFNHVEAKNKDEFNRDFWFIDKDY